MKRIGTAALAVMAASIFCAPRTSVRSGLAAPGGLSGASIRGRAVLMWDTVAGAQGYNVYRNNVHIATVGAPPYSDYAAGSNEYFVTALTTRECSERSNQVAV